MRRPTRTIYYGQRNQVVPSQPRNIARISACQPGFSRINFSTVSKKGPAIKIFLECVRAYLPTDTHVRERTTEGHPGAAIDPSQLKENRVYYFDAEAQQAFFHAVEDLAMEEATGSLASLMSGFKEFEAHRERYEHLAATIDEVLVAGSGRVPKPLRHVTFENVPRGVLRDFRLSSFANGRKQSAFICRNVIGPKEASELPALYVGFFTFNPQIASRLRAGCLASLRGKGSGLSEFDRLLAIDSAARQLEADFIAQQKAVELAMARIQMDGSVSSSGKLAIELEKGASQLAEWKNRVSTMFSQVQGPLGS